MPALDPARVLERIGRRIAEVRAERGLTQAALAEELGVATRYVQRVEAGSENLTVETLVKFANALTVPLTDLFVQPTTRAPRPGRPRKPG
jgi:transcriptional regulator with XRE-family HTH domain